MKMLTGIAGLLLVLFVACGPATYLTDSWKAGTGLPASFRKIVVLGLLRDSDQVLREKMEQHVAADLRQQGFEAVCSCNEYNPKAFQGMSETEAVAKLRAEGVDAVLTIVLLDKTSEQLYVPGSPLYSRYPSYQSPFMGYYRTVYDRIYTQGYYVRNTKYFWETNLYDLGFDRLIYTAQSQSFDPVSAESLGDEYGQMVVSDMIKNRVLGKQKKGF